MVVVGGRGSQVHNNACTTWYQGGDNIGEQTVFWAAILG